MINGNSYYNYADLNGLVNANIDDLNVNDTFQNTDANYYNNITSNIQEQINNLITISSYLINTNSLQNQINSLSGSINNNYIISNDYFNTISSYIISNTNLNNYQNLYLTSISSFINTYNTNNNNINIYQNLYLTSISSYVNTYNINNNNINTYQNLYLNSISSYINNNTIYQNNVNNYYDLYLTSLSGYIKNIQLIPGPPGINGTNGTNGTNGSNGSNGERGEKGDKGDKGDTGPQGAPADAGLILGVVNAAVTAAVAAGGVASLGALATQVETIQATVTANTANITALNTKTQFQTISLGMTNFSTGIEIGTTPANVILNPNTQSYFYKGINCAMASTFEANITTNGITNSNGISNTGGISSDSISIDSGKLKLFKSSSNVNQISYNSISTSIRDAGIEFNSNFNPFLLSDTGTINMRAGNINIGNADQTSIVYINGTVYFNNPINFSNFFNQFA